MANAAGGRSVGLLIARICLGTIFVYTGIRSIGHTADAARMLDAMGYPVPELMAVVASIAQLAGAASLILGVLTPFGCIVLILFLLPTTWSFHLPHALDGDGNQIIQTLKNVGLVGGLLSLLFTGPGGFSIDARIFDRGGKA